MVKVLFVGDVSKSSAFAKKVTKLNTKYGPFDAVFAAGTFPSALPSSPALSLPVPTYVMTPTPGVLAPNLESLGPSGILRLASGLHVAFVGGHYTQASQASSSESNAGTEVVVAGGGVEAEAGRMVYGESDLDELVNAGIRLHAGDPNFRGVDVLLTHDVPSSAQPLGYETLETARTAPLESLLAVLRPKYHVAAGAPDVFVEALPFPNVHARHVTHYIGLGGVGNASKAKAVYAVEIVPLREARPGAHVSGGGGMPNPHWVSPRLDAVFSSPAGCGMDAVVAALSGGGRGEGEDGGYSRFASGKRVQRLDGSSAAGGGDGGEGGEEGGLIRIPHRAPERGALPSQAAAKARALGGEEGRRGRKRERGGGGRPAKPSGPCWFCLASPDVEQHLVAAVGTEVYVALPKGGLVEDHVLLLPIEHYPAGVVLPPTVQSEMAAYKDALVSAFAPREVVMWERHLITRGTSHTHTQVVPVPPGSGPGLKAAFESAGEEAGITFTSLEPGQVLQDVPGADAWPYIFVELPGGERMIAVLEDGKRVDLTFARGVVATELGFPGKRDWKVCVVDGGVEAAWAEAFGAMFAEFAPEGSDGEEEEEEEE